MSWMLKITLVALGGAAGAVCRTGLAAVVAGCGIGAAFGSAAVGTMAVNLTGCLAMGFGRAAAATSVSLSPAVQTLLFSGFLGAFTTFSTFEADIHSLLSGGEYIPPALYLMVSVLGGFAAFVIGWHGAVAFMGR